MQNPIGVTAYGLLDDPMAKFDDPVIERLTSIEDWLEMMHWREIGSPENHTPLGARGWHRRVLMAGKADQDAPKKPTGNDIRAEIARREQQHADGVVPITEAKSSRKGNPKAAAIRAELNRRMAAAQ
ncbi:hypothetical protein ACJEDT_13085 [Rhodococcoides fascians]|uniref:hypothetical protein n=1 Tax=Rhodococcoides fascians TaxID=1828 RepID=UPI003899DD42